MVCSWADERTEQIGREGPQLGGTALRKVDLVREADNKYLCLEMQGRLLEGFNHPKGKSTWMPLFSLSITAGYTNTPRKCHAGSVSFGTGPAQ